MDFWAPNKAHKSPPVILEGPESTKTPNELVLPEKLLISAYYTVILGEMNPKMAKLDNFAKNWTFRPLMRSIIHQQVMLDGPQSPNSLHKLVLQENVSRRSFYTIIAGEMCLEELKLVNLANLTQIPVCGPLARLLTPQLGISEVP